MRYRVTLAVMLTYLVEADSPDEAERLAASLPTNDAYDAEVTDVVVTEEPEKQE